jgi:tetraacyldisaccharide 4'-kinase
MGTFNYIFFPLAAIYGAVSHIRNRGYDLGFLSSIEVPCPVVSVGNLTLGGTGKTPLVDLAVSWFERENKKTLILSRGYGGKYSGIAKVDLNLRTATNEFGDEPVLLARRHPKTPVYVARRRAKSAAEVYQREKPDVIILDDGFQPRRLKRSLDIVVIDPLAGPSDLKMFPVGRARESSSSLRRADAIVLTKVNLATATQLDKIREIVPEGVPLVEVRYEIESFVSLDGRTKRPLAELGPVLAVSAIGNPEGFAKTLREAGVIVKDSLVFRDHHEFESIDFDRMVAARERCGAGAIVVTEKDAVKIRAVTPNLWVAQLKLVFEKGEEKLYESFRSIFR